MWSRTLLLNSTFEPLKVISWQRAIAMLCLGKVEVVKSYETVLRSSTWRIPMPAVIRLKSYVRRRRMEISMSRRNIFLRDELQCQYCKTTLPAADLTCDHVHPKSQGGGNTWENVVAACAPCNRRKGGRTPEQASMRLVREPSRPKVLPLEHTLNLGQDTPAHWDDYIARMRKSA